MKYLNLLELAEKVLNSTVHILELHDTNNRVYTFIEIVNDRLYFTNEKTGQSFSIYKDDTQFKLDNKTALIEPFYILDTDIKIQSVHLSEHIA